MIRGTRILLGNEAYQQTMLIRKWQDFLWEKNFQQIILPSIWEQKTFIEKAGVEILEQMYVFQDKKGRDICLIPEVTAIIQEEYIKTWAKSLPKPVRLFYDSRCYRYERPQKGRYREFTQFGVEILGNKDGDRFELMCIFYQMISLAGIKADVYNSVKRGLDYYTENGFEACVPSLGAQKQVAGGGTYENGIGFAFGVDRVLLALEQYETTKLK